MYYKFGLLLLVSGAFCQHQVTQSVQPAVQSAPDRQIRLEDIETDGLKSSGAQQTPAYQQQPSYQQQQQQAYQQQQQQAYQQQQQQAYQQPIYQQQIYQQQPAQALYHHPHLQFAPAGTAYQTPQITLQPAGQQLFHSASGAYPQQYVYLQPQSHSAYNVPLMIIPSSLLQQDLVYPGLTKLRTPIATSPAAAPGPQTFLAAQPQLPLATQKFRPSPQIQYPSPYSSQVYQQKFASGAKSTPAPSVKDNYSQSQGFNFKLQ